MTESLELELLMIIGHSVGAWNWTLGPLQEQQFSSNCEANPLNTTVKFLYNNYIIYYLNILSIGIIYLYICTSTYMCVCNNTN